MRILISLIVVCSLLPADSRAVVVLLNNSNEPVMGFLVRQDERSVTLRQVLPDGQLRERTLSRSDILTVQETVETDRLEKLHHGDADPYRNYAEELAEKRRDPEARETAIRLYLIAAYLEPARLGRSSLLGMIDLARDPDEEAKFRAMAYLLDPEHDPRVLRRPETVKAESGAATPAARSGLVTALRLMRQGNGINAKRLVEQDDDVRALLGQYDQLIGLQEFYDAGSRDELSPSLLRRVLLLELALSPNSGGSLALDSRPQPGSASWADDILRDGSHPLPALKLDYLTEFNPRECQFRQGTWLEPDEL